MGTPSATAQYENHRFPAESISYAVWLYVRSSLSFHEVEKLLLEREVVVTYEAIRKLRRGLTYVPRGIITDQLKSYGAAQRKIPPGGELRQHPYLNTRRRTPMSQPANGSDACTMQVPGHDQRFLSASGPSAQHFRPRRHRLSAPASRQELRRRFQVWQEITTPALAA